MTSDGSTILELNFTYLFCCFFFRFHSFCGVNFFFGLYFGYNSLLFSILIILPNKSCLVRFSLFQILLEKDSIISNNRLRSSFIHLFILCSFVTLYETSSYDFSLFPLLTLSEWLK